MLAFPEAATSGKDLRFSYAREVEVRTLLWPVIFECLFTSVCCHEGHVSATRVSRGQTAGVEGTRAPCAAPVCVRLASPLTCSTRLSLSAATDAAQRREGGRQQLHQLPPLGGQPRPVSMVSMFGACSPRCAAAGWPAPTSECWARCARCAVCGLPAGMPRFAVAMPLHSTACRGDQLLPCRCLNYCFAVALTAALPSTPRRDPLVLKVIQCWASPKEVIVAGDARTAYYLHLLCALAQRHAVVTMSGERLLLQQCRIRRVCLAGGLLCALAQRHAVVTMSGACTLLA